MSKVSKISIFVFSTVLIVLYQNCAELSTDSITELSVGISGVESINGDIYVLDSDDLSEYLAEESVYSSFSETIPTSELQIRSVTTVNQSTTSSSPNYLCMVASQDNPSIYYPLALDDYDSTANVLVPICMPQMACDSYVSEIGTVKALESNLCKQNSLAKKYSSGQVLQLIKRY